MMTGSQARGTAVGEIVDVGGDSSGVIGARSNNEAQQPASDNAVITATRWCTPNQARE